MVFACCKHLYSFQFCNACCLLRVFDAPILPHSLESNPSCPNPPESSDQQVPSGGLSRRGFLKGAGLTAASGVVLSTGLGSLAEAAPAEPAALGPGRTGISFKVNGERRMVSIEPRQTLAEVLRDELHLTGTKVVCNRGACSACTVWLDGLPVNSCMTLAVEVGKREVTTVEGLERNGQLHPVQAAFIEHDAQQCGFCTPGMVMSCAPLLKRNAQPSLEEVKAALSGNLCRCGTYPKIFEAMQALAKR
ncbi:(2Fe-2S)-binding protein [Hymenobacter sp. B81]|uniref:(2Fe-2S)-binding protein n=1 Tax=Hymenobacter sp. B81 TaxID=3344878 RepID=UPI0037DC1C4D